jgi:glycerol-3-phosphate dehydrogenase
VPIGGKYTTSRCDAVDIVDQVFKSLGRKNVKSQTHVGLLPGAPKGEFNPWLARASAQLVKAGIEPEMARIGALRHGTRVAQLLEVIAADPSEAQRLHPEAPFFRAEVTIALRDEMAVSADDVLRRRMPLSLLAGDRVAAKVAAAYSSSMRA